MMKKVILAALLMAALPQLAAAQVEKQVEVTKAYVPRVESASKLAVEPDMTDTTQMRPEINYAITPLSLRTTLTTRPIRPATVTYWEFNRPLPFYLKVGAGYPLNSVLDFYATTQNPSTGYLTGYVNHEGRYADIRNDFGVADNNSMQMKNRAGVAAGKYLGRHILEGELSYDNRMYHRYGAFAAPGSELAPAPGSMVDFGDANLLLRFGDGFQNLERTNFEVVLRGGMFFDHSDWAAGSDPGQQLSLEGYGRIARGFGRHMLSATLGYEYLAGKKAFEGTDQGRFHAALRYGFRGGVVRLEVGADFYRDRVESAADPEPIVETGNYLIPFAHLDFNLGTPGLKPFLEVDGSVNDNSLRSMMYRNPYTASEWLDRSSVDYNGRFGLNGTLWNNRFSYRAYAGLTIHDNHVYWMALRNIRLDDTGTRSETFTGLFSPCMGRQTVTSFNGEIEYRPLSVLKFDLGVHGYAYNDEKKWSSGAPTLTANLGARYEGRKIGFGVEAVMRNSRTWNTFDVETTLNSDGSTEVNNRFARVDIPFGVDLRVDFDWKISNRVTFFAEGRNLINQRLYEYLWYPELGARFTAGIKANF